MFLRQSTSQVFRIGPFLDSTDGVTPETGLTIANTDVDLSKDGAAFAAKNSGGLTADGSNGWYSGTFNTTDTNTVGILEAEITVAGALPVWKTYYVVEETVYDALYASSAGGYLLASSNGSGLTEAGGTGDQLTAINLPNQTMDIIGSITGNLSGSVGSVTGAVGSVTGAVGSVTGSVGSVAGNVDGSTASVVGAVGSVTGAVGSVTGSVGSVAGNVDGSTASVVGAVGSVTGSVGSVTGAVGSVTGAVGSVAGNVDGSTASVVGAVGSVAGNVDGSTASVVGAVGSVTANVGALVKGFVNDTLTESSANRINDNFQVFYDNADAQTSQVVDDVGGGGGGSFWSTGEQENIRDALGVTGDKTTATGGQLQDKMPTSHINATTGDVDKVTLTDTATDVTNDVGITQTGANKVWDTPARSLTDGIIKNAAFSNLEFLMVLTSDHVTPATGLTVTGQRSIDGGAFGSVTGTIAEVSNGIYQVDLLAADTNGDVITYRFSSGTADDTFITVTTQ